jgi:hypothetical protein
VTRMVKIENVLGAGICFMTLVNLSHLKL